MEGDSEEGPKPPALPPQMFLEELHPDDQQLMMDWEAEEPSLSPWVIDPVVRFHADQKRKKK